MSYMHYSACYIKKRESYTDYTIVTLAVTSEIAKLHALHACYIVTYVLNYKIT